VIVADASAVIEVLLNTAAGGRFLEQIVTDGETLHAPHLLDLEVVQVLRRYVQSKELTPARAGEALMDLTDLRIMKYPHEPFLQRIWELRSRMSAYDAAYVTLAETLGAPLVTGDRRLARAGGHQTVVRLI
jgi:predicted nucleic acid-binding protein